MSKNPEKLRMLCKAGITTEPLPFGITPCPSSWLLVPNPSGAGGRPRLIFGERSGWKSLEKDQACWHLPFTFLGFPRSLGLCIFSLLARGRQGLLDEAPKACCRALCLTNNPGLKSQRWGSLPTWQLRLMALILDL